MVKKERIERYLKKRWNAVHTHLAGYCTEKDPECLHQLRVEIKKVNAVLFLLQACAGNGHHFPAKPLKKVFRAAGIIRAAQVNLQLLASHGIHHTAFEQEQQTIIARASEDYCAHLPRYQQKVKRVLKTLLSEAVPLKAGAVLHHYQQELDELQQFFVFPFDPEALHDQRKTLKNLLYVHALLPKALVQELNLDTDFLDSLQEKIGAWHDAVLTRELLVQNGLGDEAVIRPIEQEANNLLDELGTLTWESNWHKRQPVA